MAISGKKKSGKRLSIAIVGAGMGGLAAASTLRRAGFDAQVYEQAHRFERIGAGIQMMPNAMKVLRRIGVEDKIRATSFQPYSHLNRVWDTGEVMRELPMPEDLYGAPYLCMHRGDLHEALALGAAARGDSFGQESSPASTRNPPGSPCVSPTALAPQPTR